MTPNATQKEKSELIVYTQNRGLLKERITPSASLPEVRAQHLIARVIWCLG